MFQAQPTVTWIHWCMGTVAFCLALGLKERNTLAFRTVDRKGTRDPIATMR